MQSINVEKKGDLLIINKEEVLSDTGCRKLLVRVNGKYLKSEKCKAFDDEESSAFEVSGTDKKPARTRGRKLINKCGYVFITGKRKGKECGTRCAGDYCKPHTRAIEARKNRPTCQYVYRKRPKAGTTCGTRCTGNYCKPHARMINRLEEKKRNSCKYILTRGPRKGDRCTRKARDEGYCKTCAGKYNVRLLLGRAKPRTRFFNIFSKMKSFQVDGHRDFYKYPGSNFIFKITIEDNHIVGVVDDGELRDLTEEEMARADEEGLPVDYNKRDGW